jgi:hypothetical protein
LAWVNGRGRILEVGRGERIFFSFFPSSKCVLTMLP